MARNGEGQSVATMWGEMVAAAARGEVCMIEDKHGNEVAVMISKTEYERLEREADHEWCHYSRDEL